jgi:hypothetical protein
MKKLSVILGILLIMSFCLVGCGDTTPKHITEITKQGFETVNDDYQVYCVYADYTNNSGQTAVPADWQSVKAFQNGVEIPPIVFTGQEHEGYMPCDTSVQDGTTAKIVWMFQTGDTETEVKVEVSDLD